MKVAGFTFIRNAVKNDYPVVEAITSVLPVCDEFIVALGRSDDETEQLINSISSPKIKIIHTVWDEGLRAGGSVFARETNKAFAAISPDADWAFYIQGDEVVHEKYLPVIQKEMEDNLPDARIEGLLFNYRHFYGSYDYYSHSRRWYRREIRIVRNNPRHIHAYRDAQGFRYDDRKIRVKLIEACIYHYGWVKPPKGLESKVRNFNRFYHDDAWMAGHMNETYAFDFTNADRMLPFTGTHPRVMQRRIAAQNWKLEVDPAALHRSMSLRRRLLQALEDLTGWRISEYRNYRLVKK